MNPLYQATITITVEGFTFQVTIGFSDEALSDLVIMAVVGKPRSVTNAEVEAHILGDPAIMAEAWANKVEYGA